jgi:hypothetical protein
MGDDLNREDQLSKLLEEIKRKRVDPGALSLAAVYQDITREMTAEQERELPPEPARAAAGGRGRGDAPDERPGAEEEAPETARSRRGRGKRDSRQRAAFSKRHIIGALNAGDDEAMIEDPINKNMLAPSIERGIDIDTDSMEIDLLSGEPDDSGDEERARYAENHPIFSQAATVKSVIPEPPRAAPPPRSIQAEKRQLADALLRDNFTKLPPKKGVLNVRDNLDDNFREFFGDTVVVDQEPLGEKSRRQRKIKDFVLAENDGEIGRPVFEDDAETPQGPERRREQLDDEDTAEILAQLMSGRAGAAVKTIFTFVFAVIMAALSVAARLGVLPPTLDEPLTFYIVSLGLLALATAFNFKRVFSGFARLISFRADGESLASFAVLAAMGEGVSLVMSSGDRAVPLCGCVAALALAFPAMGSQMTAKRVLGNFRALSGIYDKYASSVSSDQNLTRRITRDLDISGAQVLLKRKVGFTDDFLSSSFTGSDFGRKVYVAASIALIVSIACGVCAFITGSDAAGALRVMCGVAALCAPFTSTISGALPISRMQKKLSRVGAVVPGYASAGEVCGANCVVLEGRELFPKGNIMLHGIKTFERERIDKAILYAASVIIQSCDTMAHMFMNVIQNKTEMLYEVESVEYEPGMGYSFWIDKTRLLLGTRKLLETHGIAVPSRDYENRYTKTSTRDAIYLAVAGGLYAMFVVSYAPNPEVMSAMKGLLREGISVAVHTRDFNITGKRISKFYRFPAGMVSIVREDDAEQITRLTEYAAHAPSGLTHIGTLVSFVNGILGCHNLRSAARMSAMIEFIGLLFGIIIGAGLTLIGNMAEMGVEMALIFQMIWAAVLGIAVFAHKY